MVNRLSLKDSCPEEHRDEGPLRHLPHPSIYRASFAHRIYLRMPWASTPPPPSHRPRSAANFTSHLFRAPDEVK
jgi:hypothetical protein